MKLSLLAIEEFGYFRDKKTFSKSYLMHFIRPKVHIKRTGDSR